MLVDADDYTEQVTVSWKGRWMVIFGGRGCRRGGRGSLMRLVQEGRRWQARQNMENQGAPLYFLDNVISSKDHRLSSCFCRLDRSCQACFKCLFETQCSMLRSDDDASCRGAE
ncbi:hypothetical protein AKJ16_DCAP24817 [Drosera capensis]